MAMAGESHHSGRESRSHFGESLAGDAEGQADGQVQGYNFRYIMTREPANRVMPQKPANYRREEFQEALEHLVGGKVNRVFVSGFDGIYRFHDPGLPNGKFDINDAPGSPVRLSLAGFADEWPDGSAETRRRISNSIVTINWDCSGFCRTIPPSAESLQGPAREWGFCRDEFVESDHLPPKIYVREARRMSGQYVFTQRDTEQIPGDVRTAVQRDSIAVLDYMLNCHGTGHEGPRFGGTHTGQFFKPIAPPQVPYGVIVPAINDNLLVPVACSSSHVGFRNPLRVGLVKAW